MTAPVTAEQVVDVDTWTVQVHADPTAELVTRLCHDLDRHNAHRVMVAHLPADHPEHQHALAALIVALQNTFTWTLSNGDSGNLEADLYEANTLPAQCQYDEKYAVTTIEGVPMCHGHAAAHDRAVEESVKA